MTQPGAGGWASPAFRGGRGSSAAGKGRCGRPRASPLSWRRDPSSHPAGSSQPGAAFPAAVRRWGRGETPQPPRAFASAARLGRPATQPGEWGCRSRPVPAGPVLRGPVAAGSTCMRPQKISGFFSSDVRRNLWCPYTDVLGELPCCLSSAMAPVGEEGTVSSGAAA